MRKFEGRRRKLISWRRMTGAGLLVPMIMWIMFPSTVILSQPVNVPGLQTGSPNQNQLQPYFDAAHSATDQSSWMSMVQQGYTAITAQWEAAVDAEIQANVNAVTTQDQFNSVAAYQAYLKNQLEISKQAALQNWQTAADAAIQNQSQQFVAALGTQQQQQTKGAAQNALGTAQDPQTNVPQSKDAWDQSYTKQLNAGKDQYQVAMNQLTENYQTFMDQLVAQDQQFQQNQQQIQQFEQQVRGAIGTSVAQYLGNLNTDPFFHAENCDPNTNACTSDMSTMTAAGQTLQTLLSGLQTSLNQNVPLSQLVQQVGNYFQVQEQTAKSNEQYWQNLIYTPGSLDPNAVVRSGQGTLTRIYDPLVGAVTDWVDNQQCANCNPAATAGLQSIIESQYLSGSGKTVSSIQSADIYGSCGACAPFPVSLGADGSLPGTSAPGSRYSQVGNRAFFYTAWGLWALWIVIPVPLGMQEDQIHVDVQYTAFDQNAQHNEQTWNGYDSNLTIQMGKWQTQFLPAIQNWENQVAAYNASYAAWQTQAQQASQQAAATYQTGMMQLELGQSDFTSAMSRQKQVADQQWSQISAGQNVQAPGLVLPGMQGLDISKYQMPQMNTSLSSQASAGLPDSSLLANAGKQFATALGGAQNLAVASTFQEQALNAQQNEVNSIAQMLQGQDGVVSQIEGSGADTTQKAGAGSTSAQSPHDQGFGVSIASNGTVTMTRSIASGSATLKEGADGADSNNYTRDRVTQIVSIVAPGAVKLVSGGDLFGEDWNRDDLSEQFSASIKTFNDNQEKYLQTVQEQIDIANKVVEDNEKTYQDAVQAQTTRVQFVQGIVQAVLGGASLGQALASQMRSQASDMIGQALGLPAGFIGNLLSGMKPDKALAAYVKSTVEEKMWEGLGNALGSQQLVTLLRQVKGQKDAAKAKAKAKQQAQIQAVATVAAVVAAPFTGGASMAVLVAASAAKGAIKGAASGGLKGALVGAAGGAISGAITSVTAEAGVNVDVNLSYSKEGGFGAGVSVGVLGGAVSVGANYTQKGGVAATASVGYDLGGTKLGLNLSYSKDQGFGGGVGLKGESFQFGVNYSKAGGASAYAALGGEDNSAGIGYSKDEGPSAYVQHGDVKNGNEKLSFSQKAGVTASVNTAHGSISYNQNTGTTVSLKGSLGDQSGSLSYNSKTGFSASVHIEDSIGVGGDLSISRDGLTSELTVNTGKMIDNINKQGAQDAADKGEPVDTSTAASRKALEDAARNANLVSTNGLFMRNLSEMESAGASLTGARQEAALRGPQLTLLRNSDKYNGMSDEQFSAAVRNMDSEKFADEIHDAAMEKQNADIAAGFDPTQDEALNVGATREGVLDYIAGEFKDLGRGFVGQLSDPTGYLDADGNFHASTCFVKGTLVSTSSGFVPIEKIKVGDYVKSFNERTGVIEYRRVTETFVHRTDLIFKITYEDGTTVETTWNHPFWIEGRGWMQVKDLRVGMESVIGADAQNGKLSAQNSLIRLASFGNDQKGLAISSIEQIHRDDTVYNFEVGGNHDYFVTEREVAVHNYDRHPARDTATAAYNSGINERGKKGETLDIGGKKYRFVDDASGGHFCEGSPPGCQTSLAFLKDGTIVQHDYTNGADVRSEFAASDPKAGSSWGCQSLGIGCDTKWVPLGVTQNVPRYNSQEKTTLAARLPDTGAAGVNALQQKLNVVSPGSPDIAALARKNPGEPVIVQIDNLSADMGGAVPAYGNNVDRLSGRMFTVVADAQGNVKIVGGGVSGAPASSYPSYSADPHNGPTSSNYGNALKPGQYALVGNSTFQTGSYNIRQTPQSTNDRVPSVAPYNYIDPNTGKLVWQGTKNEQQYLYVHWACGAPGCADMSGTGFTGGIGCQVFQGNPATMFGTSKVPQGGKGTYILADRNRPGN
ncbi:MAG: TIGR04388 family protein [Leptospirales bacterium]|nr:TIGR04388 family protein [Leptospirales bacterium]